MVCDAVNNNSFNKLPEFLKNCVRVYYNEGYHIDIPVYRKLDNNILELASSDWKESNPKAVTEWFQDEVIKQSPEGNNRQLRKIVKLIKAYKNSRESWKSKMPSGFIISILVVECYSSYDRDDITFYETIKNIHNRLKLDLKVNHPISDEQLTNDTKNYIFQRKTRTSISKS